MNDIYFEWVFSIEFEKIKINFNRNEEIWNRVVTSISPIRLLPLSLIYKSVDFQEGKLIEWVQEKVFWGDFRFNSISHKHHGHCKLEHDQTREIALVHKLDERKIMYEFGDYPAYAYIFNKNYETFTNMVFKHKFQTIYKHLHQAENDSIVYALT